jgi:hypothetical protein
MVFILLIAFFAIIIALAVIADKRKAKFFAGMHPQETISASADKVTFYEPGKVIATTGILYITNQRLVFLRYKYKSLGFIPFIGSLIEAFFIDALPVFEIPLGQVVTYRSKKTVYATNAQRNVRSVQADVSIFTKNNEEYKLNIPMYDSKMEKPEILNFLLV